MVADHIRRIEVGATIDPAAQAVDRQRNGRWTGDFARAAQHAARAAGQTEWKADRFAPGAGQLELHGQRRRRPGHAAI